MDQLYLLLFLSISMLLGSFLSGLIPMTLRLSDNKSRLLALLGSGILVGTALAIIIPEGIESLYGQASQTQGTPAGHTSEKPDQESHDNSNLISAPTGGNSTKTWTVGVSLVVGFVLMLLVDQVSIFLGTPNSHYHSEQSSTHNSRHSYSLANQVDDIDVAGDETNVSSEEAEGTGSEERLDKLVVDSHRVVMRTGDSNGSPTAATDHTKLQINPSPNRYYDHSRHTANLRAKNTKVTPTLGLVIHASADGIALGAAATTPRREVEMIIFLAIMLHKAPAAFSLVVLLLHSGLKHSTIRRHLLAFSLSAPIAALFTYFGLSQSGREALRRNNATGIAMLFSAGTFLYVATVHVLPELVSNKLLTPKELFLLVGGAFLPLLLAQTV